MAQRWREVVTDGIEWQVFRVCPVCRGSGNSPADDPRVYVIDPPEGHCHCCSRGIVVERFKTTQDLKRFASKLPDEG